MSPTPLLKAATIALVASCLAFSSDPATAGETQADRVPWEVLAPDLTGPGGPLAVLWFPTSDAEAKDSSLRISSKLTIQSTRCVAMAIVEPNNRKVRTEFEIPEPGSGVVLVDRNNEVIARIIDNGTPIQAEQVERMVQLELDRREGDAKAALEAANQKIKQKDADGAAALLTPIWEQRCIVPDLAKKAAKALKKIGRPVEATARR